MSKALSQSIFYSWQSDLPERNNHAFIGECLREAAKQLSVSEPYRVEAGAGGMPGTPNIVQVIFDRIEHSEVAVFDVTPVAEIKSERSTKYIPNPNVLVELGFAQRAIGWERIVCVMNQGYGHIPQNLPFDIQNRFPICYSYTGDDKAEKETRSEFTSDLAIAVDACLKHEHSQVHRVLSSMNHNCLALLHQFGGQQSFATTDGSLPPGLDRLLDLEVVWCHSVPASATYGYRWTHLGKRVCEEFARHAALSTSLVTNVAPPSASAS